jgi:hypothetical protein
LVAGQPREQQECLAGVSDQALSSAGFARLGMPNRSRSPPRHPARGSRRPAGTLDVPALASWSAARWRPRPAAGASDRAVERWSVWIRYRQAEAWVRNGRFSPGVGIGPMNHFETLVQNSACWQISPFSAAVRRPAGDRHAEAGHDVDDFAGDSSLGLLCGQTPRVKAATDHFFVPKPG